MSNIRDTLFFLPNWTSKLADASLSDLFASVGQNENIIVVMVLISDDENPIIYEHKRISKTITDKLIVKDLLVKYQVIQLPSSVVISTIVSDRDIGNPNGPNIEIKSMNSISKNDKDSASTEDDKPGILNTTKVHTISLNLESADEIEMKPTDLFAEAVKAYENFDLSLAASYFHKAIVKDPYYKSALFNLAGLLHMVDYPILSISYIERVLLLDKEDMIAHSFLWALTQPPEMTNIAIATYRNLSEKGDIKASSKLAALTGEGVLAGKGS